MNESGSNVIHEDTLEEALNVQTHAIILLTKMITWTSMSTLPKLMIGMSPLTSKPIFLCSLLAGLKYS